MAQGRLEGQGRDLTEEGVCCREPLVGFFGESAKEQGFEGFDVGDRGSEVSEWRQRGVSLFLIKLFPVMGAKGQASCDHLK